MLLFLFVLFIFVCLFCLCVVVFVCLWVLGGFVCVLLLFFCLFGFVFFCGCPTPVSNWSDKQGHHIFGLIFIYSFVFNLILMPSIHMKYL